MLSAATERAMRENRRDISRDYLTAMGKPLPWPRKNLPYRHEVLSGTIRSQPKHIPTFVSGDSYKHAASVLFQTEVGIYMEAVTLTRSLSRTLFKIGEGGAAIISGFRNKDGVLIADGIKARSHD
jgi:hypothetical protein